MLNQIVKIEISADTVAWYGAIIATISLIVVIYKIWIDRPRLKFSVAKEYEIWGTDINNAFRNLEPGKEFWTIQIANIGRRNIIIDAVGVEWRDKSGCTFISRDYNGSVQHFEIKPGDSRQIVIDTTFIDPKRVKNIFARDGTGKSYRYRL
jgi:hypothetical protein